MASGDYFPPKVLSANPDWDASLNFLFSDVLRRLEEEPLYPPLGEEFEAYRLLAFPVLLICISGSGPIRQLVCKRGRAEGGVLMNDREAQLERTLSGVESERFSVFLKRARFWSMPSPNEDLGCDGWNAVLEGVSGGRYHVVYRWSPTRTPFARLAEFMSELCPWRPQPSTVTKVLRWLRCRIRP